VAEDVHSAEPSLCALTKRLDRSQFAGEWRLTGFMYHAAWLADLRSELLAFPAGKHDDCVDALGLIGQLLDTISKGNRPEPPETVKRDTGYRRCENLGKLDDWKVW